MVPLYRSYLPRGLHRRLKNVYTRRFHVSSHFSTGVRRPLYQAELTLGVYVYQVPHGSDVPPYLGCRVAFEKYHRTKACREVHHVQNWLRIE